MTPRAPRRPDTTTVEIIGGPETDKLHLADPDPTWPDAFEAHANRITHLLGPAHLDLHHVGSTSVPGLSAKPIIDMLLVVEDVTAEETYLDPLVAAGYVLRVREPGHRMFRTPERDIHLHVHAPDSPDAYDLLLFRNHLRSHPDDLALYESTKRELIVRPWTHMQAYADAKNDVVAEIRLRAQAAVDNGQTAPPEVVRQGRSQSPSQGPSQGRPQE